MVWLICPLEMQRLLPCAIAVVICDNYATIQIARVNLYSITDFITVSICKEVNIALIKVYNPVNIICAPYTLIGVNTAISVFYSIFGIGRIVYGFRTLRGTIICR